MTSRPLGVAILGSTGSIGRSALEVVAGSGDTLRAVGLVARSNTQLLLDQAKVFLPQWVVATDPDLARRQDWSGLPNGVELRVGPEAVVELVGRPEVDTVLSAIVGGAGLDGTWAALEARKTVALANKESLVIAGSLVMELAKRNGVRILPVDSEHSAVFQAMQSGRREEVHRVVLTASGGPFRTRSLRELESVSVDDALAHPTWDMGPKVTIDSATLMNKALEIIEARWLFDLEPPQIGVVLHPQSIVHSLVEFVDGSVVAQMSPPDMRLPIQYALTWPQRRPGVADRMDWSQAMQLDFLPPDFERFGALRLGLEVARVGGTAGAVLNAANETAVSAFLAGRLRFVDIVAVCESVLAHHPFDPSPTLAQVRAADRWAREEAFRWIGR
jgi:1-deoxy-D-xylulose-5-phosphate reductoisomerase